MNLCGKFKTGFSAGSPREVTLPRLPRIRTCPIRASCSSGQSFAARRSYSATHPLVQDFSLASCAIRRSFVEMVSEIGILVLLSLRRSSLPGAPLPSSGALGVVPRSLRYYWGAPTSHRPRSPRLACTSGSVCSPCSLSLGTASAPASLGFGQRLPSRFSRRRRWDLPGPWGILVNVPCCLTPVGRPHPRLGGCGRCCLPTLRTSSAPRWLLSRLNHTAH